MTPSRRRAVALAAALASALALALAAPAQASADAASDEARALVNGAPVAAGVPALRIDPALSAAARSWVAVRAPAGDAQHNMRLGHLVPGASKLGEIIGRGATVDAAHNSLMTRSPTARSGWTPSSTPSASAWPTPAAW